MTLWLIIVNYYFSTSKQVYTFYVQKYRTKNKNSGIPEKRKNWVHNFHGEIPF